MRDRYEGESIYPHCTVAKPILRIARCERRLPDDLADALQVSRPRKDDYEGIITDQEFQARLGAVHRVKNGRRTQIM
jgi:hypothetical protein